MGLSYKDLYDLPTWELTVLLAMELDDAAQAEEQSNKPKGRTASQADINALG